MKTKLKEEYKNKIVKGRIGGGMSFTSLILPMMKYNEKISVLDPESDNEVSHHVENQK